jgi:putative sigma-54 modulation protein
MDHPTSSSLLAEKIVLCDRNAGLGLEPRVHALEKLSRFVRLHEHSIVRLHIDVERNPQASEYDQFTAKGQLELDGPAMLASVASDDPLRSIEFLLEKFDRQLRRRPRAQKARQPAVAFG